MPRCEIRHRLRLEAGTARHCTARHTTALGGARQAPRFGHGPGWGRKSRRRRRLRPAPVRHPSPPPPGGCPEPAPRPGAARPGGARSPGPGGHGTGRTPRHRPRRPVRRPGGPRASRHQAATAALAADGGPRTGRRRRQNTRPRERRGTAPPPPLTDPRSEAAAPPRHSDRLPPEAAPPAEPPGSPRRPPPRTHRPWRPRPCPARRRAAGLPAADGGGAGPGRAGRRRAGPGEALAAGERARGASRRLCRRPESPAGSEAAACAGCAQPVSRGGGAAGRRDRGLQSWRAGDRLGHSQSFHKSLKWWRRPVCLVVTPLRRLWFFSCCSAVRVCLNAALMRKANLPGSCSRPRSRDDFSQAEKSLQ